MPLSGSDPGAESARKPEVGVEGDASATPVAMIVPPTSPIVTTRANRARELRLDLLGPEVLFAYADALTDYNASRELTKVQVLPRIKVFSELTPAQRAPESNRSRTQFASRFLARCGRPFFPIRTGM